MSNSCQISGGVRRARHTPAAAMTNLLRAQSFVSACRGVRATMAAALGSLEERSMTRCACWGSLDKTPASIDAALGALNSVRDISCHLFAAYESWTRQVGKHEQRQRRQYGSQPPTLARSSPRLRFEIRQSRRTAPHRTLHLRHLAPQRRSCPTNAGRLPPPHCLELLHRYNLLFPVFETTLHIPVHTHPAQSETLGFRHRRYQRLLREPQHPALADGAAHVEGVLPCRAQRRARGRKRKSRDPSAAVRAQGSAGIWRRCRAKSMSSTRRVDRR
ncbi:uncharacterized protein CC84DRAFT_1208747 [Paraphaeosphaeria sporulosa]|uniref:Uncharacterized protein n=1 Tax=Paraphaeosphaeria sporulosa TaxID=1460663 RepID=A0A177C4E0_9PLEO|nr:uncharacterized protein CC84DRAFT_1208747 [Paraphaeosphaeria sporulosa]OAG01658.1 hypothetical protein CC84DRAFT_1208747 [Paraphaeosphaeria sporulosa]